MGGRGAIHFFDTLSSDGIDQLSGYKGRCGASDVTGHCDGY
jgi:hypothetical protein